MKFTIPGKIPRAALITGGAQQPAIASALADAGFAIALQCHPGGPKHDLPARSPSLPADLSRRKPDGGPDATVPRRRWARSAYW